MQLDLNKLNAQLKIPRKVRELIEKVEQLKIQTAEMRRELASLSVNTARVNVVKKLNK